MTESTIMLRIVRFAEMIFLPAALLLGMVYFCPEMDKVHMLVIAVLATWLVDQVGSFACLYRGKPLGRGVERCFFPINAVSTAATWWWLQSGPIKESHEKWLIVSAILAALGFARVIDDILTTHARPHKKIDWSQAFCFQQRKTKPAVVKVDLVDSQAGSDEAVTDVHDEAAVESMMEVVEPSEVTTEAEKVAGNTEEVAEQATFTVQVPIIQIGEAVAGQVKEPGKIARAPDSTVRYRVCEFDELVKVLRTAASSVETPKRDETPDLVRGSPHNANGNADGNAGESFLANERVEKIAEEISVNLTSQNFEPETAETIAMQAMVQAEVGATVTQAQEENKDKRNSDLIADLSLEMSTARKQTRKTRLYLGIVFGALLGVVGARLGLGVLAPLRQISLAIEVVVLVILLLGAFVMGSLGLSLTNTEPEQCKWLSVVIASIAIVGLPTYVLLRRNWFTVIEVSRLDLVVHPVDVLIILNIVGYVYLLSHGVGYLKMENTVALQLVNAMSAPGATAADLRQAEALKYETLTKFSSASLRWIWGLKKYDDSLLADVDRAA